MSKESKKANTIIYFVAFLLLMIVASYAYPKDGDGKREAPEWMKWAFFIAGLLLMPILLKAGWDFSKQFSLGVM